MIVLINTAAFAACAVIIFFLVKEMSAAHVLTVINDSLRDRALKRREYEEQKAIDEGIGEHGIFFETDLALVKSGIQAKLPFFTTEVLIICMAATAVILFAICSLNHLPSIISLAAAITGIFSWYMLIKILLNRNTRRIESNMMKFVNLIENYSRVSDDIKEIFKYTAPFLDEPLKSAVDECVTELEIKSDTYAAFKKLEIRVGHRQFGELIRNIELCSRHNTDYAAVIRKNRDVIQDYLSEKQTRKQMANSARTNIIILYAGAFVSLKMVSGIGELDLNAMLLATRGGNIILSIVFAVIVFSIWKMIKMYS